MTSIVPSSQGAIKAIHIQVPVGIPTADGGLEIPNRVFLGGIPTETTELELELFFSDYGVVKDVRIVTDRVTGECKGYGFVTFDENEDIESMVRKKTINMKGKKLRIRKAVRRNGSQFNTSSSSDSSSNCSSVSPTEYNGGCDLPQQMVYVHQTPQQQQHPSQIMYTPNASSSGVPMSLISTVAPSSHHIMASSQPMQPHVIQPVYYVPCMPNHNMQLTPVFQ